MISQSPAAAAPQQPKPSNDLSAEREKIMQLLESGKINAAESAELLNALGETVRSNSQPIYSASMSSTQKMILAGGAVVLLSFFLPWFSYNPGQEATRLAEQVQNTMRENAGLPQISSSFNLKTDSIDIKGGDISHGLGWLVLLFGIAAVALPFVASEMNRETRWKISVATLGVGAIILIYLFTGNIRYVSIGILLSLAGYILIFTGFMKQRHALLSGY